jgi:hypothetical protein
VILYGFAKLTDQQLQKCADWEAQTGKRLLVFRQFETEPAMLDRKQVDALRALEQELGDIIIAVD